VPDQRTIPGVVPRESDTAWLERVLASYPPGRWVTTTDLLARSLRERGVGLTVHSRAADLRRAQRQRGDALRVVCERLGTDGRGRAVYAYRLRPVAVAA